MAIAEPDEQLNSACSPDPVISPDGYGLLVGEPGDTNEGCLQARLCSPDPAKSPGGFGQLVGEPGDTNAGCEDERMRIVNEK